MKTTHYFSDEILDAIECCKDFSVLVISTATSTDQPCLLTLNYQHQIVEVPLYKTDDLNTFNLRAKEELLKIYQRKLDDARKEVVHFEKKIADLVGVSVIKREIPEIRHIKRRQQYA